MQNRCGILPLFGRFHTCLSFRKECEENSFWLSYPMFSGVSVQRKSIFVPVRYF